MHHGKLHLWWTQPFRSLAQIAKLPADSPMSIVNTIFILFLSLVSSCASYPKTSLTHAHGVHIPPGGGQVLVLRQPPIPGDISIKIAPNMGHSDRFSMGTQNLPPSYAIPVHKHLAEDEILFVHEGTGTATIGDQTFPVYPGSTLYIPNGVWHTVVNHTNAPAQLIWVTAAPGIEDFFRRIGIKPGEPWTPLSPEELSKISAEYGMIIKPQVE